MSDKTTETTAILSEIESTDMLTIMISGVTGMPRGTQISFTIVIGEYDDDTSEATVASEPVPEPPAPTVPRYMGSK